MKIGRNHSSRLLSCLIGLSVTFSLFLSSCSDIVSTQTPPVVVSPVPSQTPLPPQAVVTFAVEVPSVKNSNQSIAIDILDEVTGLALNPNRFEMQTQDNQHYTLRLPFPIGSVVKYRYLREGDSSSVEYNTHGDQVRYRLYYVTGTGLVNDNVAAWNNLPFTGATGRISGLVVNSSTNAPIPGLLMTANGIQTFTNADGTYNLEGIPTGTHNMVAYSLDGSYHTFQQGANVEANLNTPASLKLTPSHFVNITFNVSVPADVVGAPLRMSGNLYQLGNTFADLAGGVNSVASRMPELTFVSENRYTLTLSLPSGADIRYKYTLGDGFWNSEQTSAGQFRIRQLMVPETDQVIDEKVDTWKSGSSAPITFEVKVPDNTPPSDTLSIQFNPFGWMEPIPMWSLGNNRWLYTLYGPQNLLSSLSYRYCRNDQCGSADDSATQGLNPAGSPVNISLLPQNFQDEIRSWAWWNPSSSPTTIVAADIKPRGSSFVAGIELQPNYHPSWQSHYLPMLQKIQTTGANWVILTPSWSYTTTSSAVISIIPGQNPLWPDLVNTIDQAQDLKLNTAVFPTPIFPQLYDQWWESSPRDSSWWQSWFDHYRVFILNNADLCAQNKVQALILGGDWLLPALPGGLLKNGQPSGVPGDADTRWRQLIAEVKQHYSGSILWAIPYPDGMKTLPAFLSEVDQLYILFSSPFASKSSPTEQDLEVDFTHLIDGDVLLTHNLFNKPVIIGIDYPSIHQAAVECVKDSTNTCVPSSFLDQPSPDLPGATLDLQRQVDIYNAVLAVVNQHDWISGFVSRGYYPPAALQDKSRSINGKPAFDVLWYWYSRIITAKQ